MAEISIIIPVYNVEKYLTRCLDSILRQSYQDFEIILIDDGSNDQSGDICEAYALHDRRIQVFHQHNQGQGAARNKGLDWVFFHSNSEWITFIDSDDWVHSRYLECLYESVHKHNTRISVCNYLRCTEEHTDMEGDIKWEFWEPEEFHCQCDGKATVICGKLFFKPLFKTIRFPEGRTYEDKATTFKLLFAEEKFIYIDSPLYYYFQNPNSTTLSEWSPKQIDVFTALEEQIQFFDTNGFIKAAIHAKKEYVYKLNNTLSLLQKDYPFEYKKEKKIIKVKIRKALKHLKDVWNFADNKWIYAIVYPRRMNIYWLLTNVINRIRKQ